MSKEENDALLKELDVEWHKFTKRDDAKINTLISLLMQKGVYPIETIEGNPNSVEAMVNGWGAYWHVWGFYNEVLNCPLCGADLRDLVVGPPFTREIAIIENDRCVRYRCRDCTREWDRTQYLYCDAGASSPQ